MNTLIIEDNELIVRSLSNFLNKWNIPFKIAFDIKSAKSSLQENNYDLIIADVNLPDGNSIDFLKTNLKINNYSPNIIIATADKKSLKQYNFEFLVISDILKKPFVGKKLWKAIKKAMPNNSFNSFELDKEVKTMFNNDKQLINKVLKDLHQQILEANKEICAALKKEDFHSIYQISHQVKASLKLMRLDDLAKCFSKIEKHAASKNKVKVNNWFSKLNQLNLDFIEL